MLYELIYSSSATHNVENRMVENILTEARRNNTENDVTGLLIFDGASFCQLIEGSKTAIDKTFEKIKADTRHENVSVFHSGPIENRSFSEWAMSYKWVENNIGREGWLSWLEGQLLINGTNKPQTTGQQIFKFVNNIS